MCRSGGRSPRASGSGPRRSPSVAQTQGAGARASRGPRDDPAGAEVPRPPAGPSLTRVFCGGVHLVTVAIRHVKGTFGARGRCRRGRPWTCAGARATGRGRGRGRRRRSGGRAGPGGWTARGRGPRSAGRQGGPTRGLGASSSSRRRTDTSAPDARAGVHDQEDGAGCLGLGRRLVVAWEVRAASGSVGGGEICGPRRGGTGAGEQRVRATPGPGAGRWGRGDGRARPRRETLSSRPLARRARLRMTIQGCSRVG